MLAEICDPYIHVQTRITGKFLAKFGALYFSTTSLCGLNELDTWSQFEHIISHNFCEEDDPTLWQAAINLIFHEASFLARCAADSTSITAVIGCCSHWLRPHQTRWTADGGFAWPSGYGGRSYSRTGRPEHDWSTEFHWDPIGQIWSASKPDIIALERLVIRITVPARTSLHSQAAIPATWSKGTPVLPQKPIYQIYGFRKQSNQWNCTATNETGAKHYELAAEHNKNKPR
ncbi:MAG: hypothetical protein GY820_45455 [Gammaproteobacteria bacterium]|nr:hypothetical protein [Gammaproteobacteria bacterium]